MPDHKGLCLLAIEEVQAYLRLASPGARALLERATFCVRRLPPSHPAAQSYIQSSLAHSYQLLPEIALERVYAPGVERVQYIGWRGLLQLSRLYDYNVVLLALDRAVELFPLDEWLYLARARALFAVQYYAAVLEDCAHAQQLDPLNSAAYLLEGEAEYLLGHYWEAQAALTDALSFAPDHPRAYLDRAMARYALAERERVPDQRRWLELQATRDLERAEALRPDMQGEIERVRQTYFKG